MRYASFVKELAASSSDAWEIHTEALQRQSRGEPIIVLSVGDPDFDTPAGIVDACKAALDAGTTKYSPAGGIDALTDAIARFESARLGQRIDPANIAVTAGAQNALYVTMCCLLEAGDEAILLAPPYVMFDGVVRSAGAVPVQVPLDTEAGFSINLDALRDAITPKTRVVLLNSPHNPSGAVAESAEVAAVLEICRKNNITLISDEVYADLCFDAPFVSPYGMDGGMDSVIIVRSMSKSHAMSGWRVGWVIGPDEFCRHSRNLLNAIQYGGSAFVQHAAAHALDQEQDALVEMKQAYLARRGVIQQHLGNIENLEILRPDAGIFCLAKVAGLGLNGDDFARRLLDEEGVSVLPGNAFGPSLNGYVRISLCQPEKVLIEAADRIKSFINRQ